MRFPAFDMERMQSTWEHRIRYDLSESGVEPLTLGEIAPDLSALARAGLGYAAGPGRDETRALVASFHGGAAVENVLVTTGTSEANFLALTSLVDPGDEVVIVLPNYMQVHGVAHGIGATVREVWLRQDGGWSLDLDALRAAVTDRTKLVCVCTPNNPTGQILTEREIDAVVRIAEPRGAWILADEVYRGAERSGGESPTFWGRGDRVVVTGGLSKAYGLPGLRIGWMVAPPRLVETAWALKDYTTIAPATLSEILAEAALRRRDELLERTRGILRERWLVLEAWGHSHGERLRWTEPAAGAICFFAYDWPFDSVPFVDRLIRECSTMIVPGAHFGCERHLRIGFGMSAEDLRAGLAAIDALVADSAHVSGGRILGARGRGA